jgi:DNA-binding transcriptional MerR regulator
MSDTFAVGEVATLLQVSAPSVRRWAGAFAEHLSGAATPPAGAERRFSRDDVRLLAYAKRRLDLGLPIAIVAQELPTASLPTWGEVTRNTLMSPADSAVTAWTGDSDSLLAAFAAGQAQQNAAVARLAEQLDRIADLGALGARLEDLAGQVADLRAQVERLQAKSHKHRRAWPHLVDSEDQ